MRIKNLFLASGAVLCFVSTAHAGNSFIEYSATVAKPTPSIINLGKPAALNTMRADSQDDEAAMAAAAMDGNPPSEMMTETAEKAEMASNSEPSKRPGPVMVIKDGEVTQAAVRPTAAKASSEKKPDDVADGGKPSKPETDDMVTSATGDGKEAEKSDTPDLMAEPFKAEQLRQ